MMADDKPIHELRFDAAVKVIQSLPPNGSFQPSNDMMLKFYSYYKQATQGPCDIPRPGFWDPVGKVKWDAWKSLGNMPKEEAMTAYVDELKLILESMPVTDEVENLLQVLGPFYEMVDENKKKVNQVSDLTTGFGSMLSSTPKSVTKSIVTNLEMNGMLERHSGRHESDGKRVETVKDVDELQNDMEILPARQGIHSEETLIPNGNTEQKASLMTNGTHVSQPALDSEEDSEEEEEDDIALNVPHAEIKELNGHLLEHSEDTVGHHHLASDSDSEVYCDSVDQFGLEETSEFSISRSLEVSCSPEEPKVPGSGDKKGHLEGRSGGIQHGGEDGTSSGSAPQRERRSLGGLDSSPARRGRGSRLAGEGSRGGPLGGAGDGDRRGPEGGAQGSLNEQIVTALARLQEDMQSVLQRLHTLEALTASQARALALQPNYPSQSASKRPSWWPFNISPGTVAFAIIWPFVVQWLVQLYLQRRRRKMN